MLNTASAVIAFYSELQDRIAHFYDVLAENERTRALKETFETFAKENLRHKEIVQRTYREVITDALEACFAFNIDDANYNVNTDIARRKSLSDMIEAAIEVETIDKKFCVEAADKSGSLMSDLPQIFARVGKKKMSRTARLQALLREQSQDER